MVVGSSIRNHPFPGVLLQADANLDHVRILGQKVAAEKEAKFFWGFDPVQFRHDINSIFLGVGC